MRILHLETEFKIEKHGLDLMRFCLLLHRSAHDFLEYVFFSLFYGS